MNQVIICCFIIEFNVLLKHITCLSESQKQLSNLGLFQKKLTACRYPEAIICKTKFCTDLNFKSELPETLHKIIIRIIYKYLRR